MRPIQIVIPATMFNRNAYCFCFFAGFGRGRFSVFFEYRSGSPDFGIGVLLAHKTACVIIRRYDSCFQLA